MHNSICKLVLNLITDSIDILFVNMIYIFWTFFVQHEWMWKVSMSVWFCLFVAFCRFWWKPLGLSHWVINQFESRHISIGRLQCHRSLSGINGNSIWIDLAATTPRVFITEWWGWPAMALKPLSFSQYALLASRLINRLTMPLITISAVSMLIIESVLGGEIRATKHLVIYYWWLIRSVRISLSNSIQCWFGLVADHCVLTRSRLMYTLVPGSFGPFSPYETCLQAHHLCTIQMKHLPPNRLWVYRVARWVKQVSSHSYCECLIDCDPINIDYGNVFLIEPQLASKAICMAFVGPCRQWLCSVATLPCATAYNDRNLSKAVNAINYCLFFLCSIAKLE